MFENNKFELVFDELYDGLNLKTLFSKTIRQDLSLNLFF